MPVIEYPSQYNPNVNYATSQLDSGTSHIANPGLMGGRLRYKFSSFTNRIGTAALDQVRLFSMKSSDIIVSLTNTSGNVSAVDECNLGFAYPNEGAFVKGPTGVISAVDDIAADVTLGGAELQEDWLYHTDTTGARMGMTNWERMNAGAATYLVDPCETWELTLSYVGITTDASLVGIEMWYVAT